MFPPFDVHLHLTMIIVLYSYEDDMKKLYFLIYDIKKILILFLDINISF